MCSPLLLQLSGKIFLWEENPIFGEYLIELLESGEYLPDLDLNSNIILGTQYFKSKAPLEQVRRHIDVLCTWETSMDKHGLSTFKADVMQYWQTISMINCFSKNQGTCWLLVVNKRAEIYLLKSEYLESRKLQIAIASSCQPTSYNAILANLNIACIDITTGVDSKIVRQNLQVVQSHLNALYGHSGREMALFSDHAAAELCLRDGALGTANKMYEKCFALSQDISTDLPLLSLERLGDLSTGMHDIPTTLRWTVIFLGKAMKWKDKRQTMQAFRYLGQIFSTKGDNETALNLFTVALDGFTFMDVHCWRADCMVMEAVEFWKAARPLLERSSQMKAIIKIDAKLGEVDSAFLDQYEQLQQLSGFYAPGSAPELTYIEENEEEDNLAQGSDSADKRKQGVLV
ncbi:hypothetical protein C8J57DRAFT_1622329 [Mycena rebaudengoi]|nr:hypothetical protein C8J57DRAFT_1622329 [Mycena rebaudengoi]